MSLKGILQGLGKLITKKAKPTQATGQQQKLITLEEENFKLKGDVDDLKRSLLNATTQQRRIKKQQKDTIQLVSAAIAQRDDKHKQCEILRKELDELYMKFLEREGDIGGQTIEAPAHERNTSQGHDPR